MLYGLLGLLQVALLVYAVLDVVTTPREQVRTLPKLLWLVLVVVVPLAGPVGWLLAGRPQGRGGRLPVLGTPGPAARRPAAPTVGSAPDDDEDFLRQLRQRAEEQRRRAREEGEDPAP